jgi:hypothetical protein
MVHRVNRGSNLLASDHENDTTARDVSRVASRDITRRRDSCGVLNGTERLGGASWKAPEKDFVKRGVASCREDLTNMNVPHGKRAGLEQGSQAVGHGR